MTNLLPFTCKPQIAMRGNRNLDSATVLPFPKRLPIAYADRVLFEGRKRLFWAAVCVDSDGQESAHWCKTEKDARWLATVFLANYADRRALDRDPLSSIIRQILALPRQSRHEIGRRLLADQ